MSVYRIYLVFLTRSSAGQLVIAGNRALTRKKVILDPRTDLTRLNNLKHLRSVPI